MNEHPNYGLTNAELIKYLELPEDIIEKLQTEQGSEFTATANQFLSAIVNKIVYQRVDAGSFTNPFKQYDGYPVRYGDTIENIFVPPAKGYKFDPDATNPFAKKKPSVKALYATINYEMQYKVTIEDALLRRACLSEYGFMNLIDYILGSLKQGMDLDEYFATLGMLNNADIFADGFETITKGSDDAQTAAIVTKKIVDTVSAFGLPMTANNKMRVLNPSAKDDILLVIKYDLLNSINLDFLTGVFNLSKVDLLKRIVTVDSFQVAQDDGDDGLELVGEDIDFMIIDTRGFDNHVALQDNGMIYNPEGKYTNHYTNLWKIISFKYWFNARAFKLVAATESASESEGD